MLNDLSDFIAADREHPGLTISFALAVGIIVWGAFAFLHKREGALRSQKVRNAERETKAAERLATVYRAQLDDAEKRLKELAPQSQATDLASLLDDLTRKVTATAEVGEALMPNRLVHIAQQVDGRSVVLLADKLIQLEAHGFLTRFYGRGEEVRIERMGQVPIVVRSDSAHALPTGDGRDVRQCRYDPGHHPSERRHARPGQRMPVRSRASVPPRNLGVKTCKSAMQGEPFPGSSPAAAPRGRPGS